MRCSPQAPLASKASSPLPRGWWGTSTVIRGGVEDPVAGRVGPHVSVHGLLGNRHDPAVRHVAPLPLRSVWLLDPSHPRQYFLLRLGLSHAAERGKLLGSGDVSQEPGVYLRIIVSVVNET